MIKIFEEIDLTEIFSEIIGQILNDKMDTILY